MTSSGSADETFGSPLLDFLTAITVLPSCAAWNLVYKNIPEMLAMEGQVCCLGEGSTHFCVLAKAPFKLQSSAGLQMLLAVGSISHGPPAGSLRV